MSTDTDMQARRVDRTDDIGLPMQRRPSLSAGPRVDHVRAHGRSCWWDHTECRWNCSREP